MLYKFKSKVASDVIMLEPNGRQILGIWGKDGGESVRHGILLPQEIPTAIAQLEAAIAHDEAERAHAALQAQARGETVAVSSVSLRQRATPLLDMARRSLADEKEIVWGA
jgi:hypothetical protein